MKTLSYDFNIAQFRIEKKVSSGNITYSTYFMHDYYPTRYQDIDEDIKRVRRLVYDFKDGRGSFLCGMKISNAILHQRLNLDNACICIIPASTSAKTEKRYAWFCKEVSKTVGITNGYSCITNLIDRQELKGQAFGDKISTFLFRYSLYRGKKILLFDDVYTTGTSFRQVADKLMSTGAYCVIGIFLAKTISEVNEIISPPIKYSTYNYMKPDDYDEDEIEPEDVVDLNEFDEFENFDEKLGLRLDDCNLERFHEFDDMFYSHECNLRINEC